MKKFLLVLVAILICSLFVVAAEAKKKKHHRVKCSGKIVSCKKIAKSVCAKDKACRTKAYKSCRASRKRTVKKVSKHVKGRKCRCNTKAAFKCGDDELCKQKHTTRCVARCDSKRVRHVCKSVVRDACKHVAVRVCADKKCARRAWKLCKKAGKVRKVPRVCRKIAKKNCRDAEHGKKACRQAVKALCVTKHAAHKKRIRLHKKYVTKKSRRIASIVCAHKAGRSRRRCVVKVVKSCKKYFKSQKKQVRKLLRQCACRYKAVKSCGVIADGRSIECKKLSIKSCQKQCLSSFKTRKTTCAHIAKRVCKGRKGCTKKVRLSCSKGVKAVKRHAKKSSVFRRCACKVKSLKKCGDDKVCRTTYRTKCSKKCSIKRNAKKLVKRHIRRTAKKLARVVCKGRHGKKLRKCVTKVHRRVRKHFKKIARHHKRVLRGCACKQQAVRACVTVDGIKQCKKIFRKDCKKQCVSKLFKKAKRTCARVSRQLCKSGKAKCVRKVLKHCKKGAKRVRRVIVHRKKHVRIFKLKLKNRRHFRHGRVHRKSWLKKHHGKRHLGRHGKKHHAKKHYRKFKVNKFDCFGKAIKKCGLLADGKQCRTKYVSKCHKRHHIRWTQKNLRRYYKQVVRRCNCDTRVAKKCATAGDVETCTVTKKESCVAKCAFRRQFLKHKLRKLIAKPSGCKTKSVTKCGFDQSEQSTTCVETHYSTCKQKVATKRVFYEDLLQLCTGNYVHPN